MKYKKLGSERLNVKEMNIDKNPLVSVVIPAYNVDKYIDKCIQSVLSQTYDNWELLLVVGGQDKTVEICDSYAAKDKRIKSIHDNHGLAPARNVGFEHATGEWITYIDGDDWTDPETLEVTVKKALEYPNLDVVFWTYENDLDGKPIPSKWTYSEFKDEELFDENGCKELAYRTLKYSCGISVCYSKLISMVFAKKFGIKHDHRLLQGEEGVEFSLRCFYYARKALFLKKPFYHYVFNRNSISKKVNYKNTKNIADCFMVMREDIENFGNPQHYIPLYYERMVYGIIAMAMNTYFNPSNTDSVPRRIKLFKKDIMNNNMFAEALEKVTTENMDKLRKITLFFIRHRMFLVVQLIAWVKWLMIRFNFFSY